MKKKQWIALLLALALVAALPTAALAAPRGAIAPAFTDISDPRVAESADLLRLLGIVNGTGGTSFRPQNNLSRAEFCKMAVELLGEGGKAASQMNRTIFRDVPSTHWARGYIHVAAQASAGENAKAPLIRGDGAGYFHPDNPITFAEAVTILMRVLGYSDDTVGFSATWYDAYLSTAAQIGLTDNVSAAPQSSITRGDAAVLFANLLYTQPRNSKDSFLISNLGGSVTDPQLVLEVKGQETSDGGWVFRTLEKNYHTRRDNLSAAYQGQHCKLVLDKDGDVLALQPDETQTTRKLLITQAEARYVITQEKEQVLVDPATPVYQDDQSKSTYGDIYSQRIPYGASAVFSYDKTGTLQFIYLLANSSNVITAVITPDNDPFSSILTSLTPTVFKNGVPVTSNDRKPYDVGVFDGSSGVLRLFDRKITGVYENAAPSPVSPHTITLMGAQFNVLDCALKDLVNFKLGDRMTLLLDGDNNVAGVVSPDKVSAEVYGVATITKGAPDARGRDTYTASVALSIGVTAKGSVSSSVTAMERAPSQLVSVTSSDLGTLQLSAVTSNSSSVPGAWRPLDGTLGNRNVSPLVAVYDKVGNGPLVRVPFDQVTATSIAVGQIAYYHTDNSGSVDLIILNDATGECYTYGRVSFTPASGSGMSHTNATVTVSNSSDSLQVVCNDGMSRYDHELLGIAPSVSMAEGTARMESTVTLRRQTNVRRTAFGETSVTIGDTVYPLASNIDDCCYNAKSDTWFGSLKEALAYTSTLTIYYDRAPSQGGKIRLVVVE